MRNAALLLSSLILLVVSCGGRGEVIWSRTIDCDADAVGAGLASDGTNLVAVGTKAPRGKSSVWVVQALGLDGRLLWRREYSQGESGLAGDVAVGSRSELYICGTCVIEGRNMCVVVRMTPDGRIAWQRALAVGDASRANGICLSDGVVFVCGSVRNKGDQDMLVLALDPEKGETRWSKAYDFGPIDEATAIAANDSGEIAFTGQAGTSENPDILIGRLKENGDTAWTRRYDSGEPDRAGSVALDVFYGNVVVTGTGREGDSARCVVLEYQPNGGFVREVAYHKDVTAEGRGITATADGGLFVTGLTRAPGSQRLLAFDYRPNSAWVWERMWGRAGIDAAGDDVWADGDVFVLGTVEGSSGRRNMVVVRFSRPRQSGQQNASEGQDF